MKTTTVLGMLVVAATLGFAEVRVSTSDAMRAAVSKTQPVYSAVARQVKVAGKVEVEVVIGTDGNVESAKALTGNPLLTQSAVSAVQKWKFTPFTADGQPTKAVANLSFDFKP